MVEKIKTLEFGGLAHKGKSHLKGAHGYGFGTYHSIACFIFFLGPQNRIFDNEISENTLLVFASRSVNALFNALFFYFFLPQQ